MTLLSNHVAGFNECHSSFYVVVYLYRASGHLDWPHYSHGAVPPREESGEGAGGAGEQVSVVQVPGTGLLQNFRLWGVRLPAGSLESMKASKHQTLPCLHRLWGVRLPAGSLESMKASRHQTLSRLHRL